MKFLSFFFVSLCLNLYAEVELAPELVAQLKSSQRWILLSPVVETPNDTKISSSAKTWLQQHEIALQALNLEPVTLSKKERLQLEQLWSNPFTTRFSTPLIEASKALNANLLSAYFDAEDTSSLTYTTYTLKQQRQWVYRTQSDALDKTNAAQSDERAPKDAYASKEAPVQESLLSESMTSWLNDHKIGLSLDSNTRRRQRDSGHQLATDSQEKELHDDLMSHQKITQYLDSLKNQNDSQLKTACLSQLDQAHQSWMSSNKLEHLCLAYAINQKLQTPDLKLTQLLLTEIREHREFLNDWNSDVSR